MHMAMVCSDDPVKSVDEVKLDGAGRYATLFGQAGAAEYIQFCSLIGREELPDSTDVDVTTDVPTLLLSGDLDVATPTSAARRWPTPCRTPPWSSSLAGPTCRSQGLTSAPARS